MHEAKWTHRTAAGTLIRRRTPTDCRSGPRSGLGAVPLAAAWLQHPRGRHLHGLSRAR